MSSFDTGGSGGGAGRGDEVNVSQLTKKEKAARESMESTLQTALAAAENATESLKAAYGERDAAMDKRNAIELSAFKETEDLKLKLKPSLISAIRI